MQDFYLIRHGETDWNIKTRRFQGHTDIPLNEIGQTQAQELKGLIQGLKIQNWVASDLSRARKTAELIMPTEQELTIDPRLREVHLGQAEGLTPEQVDERFGADFRKKWSSFHVESLSMSYPGGETRQQVQDRFIECINHHLKRSPHQTTAFVSHGFIIRSFIYYCGLQAPDFFIPNCALVPFRFDAEKNHFFYIGPQNPEELIKASTRSLTKPTTSENSATNLDVVKK